MKNLAIAISTLTFFVMALVGMATGQVPWVCATRALLGAVVAFVAARIATRMALDVMIQAVVGGKQNADEQADTEQNRDTE
jgi:hypothetical protein